MKSSPGLHRGANVNFVLEISCLHACKYLFKRHSHILLKGTPERVRTTGLRHSILNKHPKEVNFGNCIY